MKVESCPYCGAVAVCRAAGTFLAHIVRRGIHEAVERRTA